MSADLRSLAEETLSNLYSEDGNGHVPKIPRPQGYEVLAAAQWCSCFPNTCETWCEHSSCAILLLDGKYYAAEESSDTTGHGCQCSGSLEIFDTYEDAVRMGLTEEARKVLNAG